jgi:hypothetical protein
MEQSGRKRPQMTANNVVTNAAQLASSRRRSVIEQLSGGGDRGVGALGSVVGEQDRHERLLAAEARGARSAS